MDWSKHRDLHVCIAGRGADLLPPWPAPSSALKAWPRPVDFLIGLAVPFTQELSGLRAHHIYTRKGHSCCSSFLDCCSGCVCVNVNNSVDACCTTETNSSCTCYWPDNTTLPHTQSVPPRTAKVAKLSSSSASTLGSDRRTRHSFWQGPTGTTCLP